MRRLLARFVVTAAFLTLVGSMSAPAFAAQEGNAGSNSASSANQALEWQFVGFYATLSACSAEGQEWVRRGWAYRYDCTPASPSGYGLWIEPA